MTLNTSPLFILSTERSGSTLLRYILDTHELIGCPGELLLGGLAAGLTRVFSGVRPAAYQKWLDDAEVCHDVREVLDRIMQSYLDRIGKVIWCDKTPLNVAYLGLLVKIFPEARYLCLYRNCLDVAYSALEAYSFGCAPGVEGYAVRYPNNFVRGMVENWADKTERIVDFERDHSGSCVRLRYEDLVAGPTAQMSRIFDFLGIGWSYDILEAALAKPHYEGGGDQKIKSEREIHQRSIGTGKRIPLAMLPPFLINRVNSLLLLLRYPAIETCGSEPKRSEESLELNPDRDSALTPPERGISTVQAV
jgi:protein-tyrosine sulfotransferase